jgi:hypothetical protein
LCCQRVVMSKERDIFDDNLEREAPMLNSIPKSNPFTVPDGYFDTLPALIVENCKKSSKRIPTYVVDKIFWLFRPQWMIAACVFIAGIAFFLRTGNNTLTYETIAANLPDSVIMQHLQNNIDYVDINSLEEMTTSSGPLGVLPQQLAQDTTNEQITNYLLNNGVDASDIENEL